MPRAEKNIVVMNKKGLHARPAVLFVQMADKFNVAVTIAKGEEQINGKSIMALLMLGAQYNTPLRVTVDGDDAQRAAQAIEEFFSKQEEDLAP